ncbi:MAG TPA: hypothetical protein VN926_10335 [Bradyrhizobium sp.]|nr:hypothetical protein [Bradyrhizobium sp.]
MGSLGTIGRGALPDAPQLLEKNICSPARPARLVVNVQDAAGTDAILRQTDHHLAMVRQSIATKRRYAQPPSARRAFGQQLFVDAQQLNRGIAADVAVAAGAATS